jgi:hypothetical protein
MPPLWSSFCEWLHSPIWYDDSHVTINSHANQIALPRSRIRVAHLANSDSLTSTKVHSHDHWTETGSHWSTGAKPAQNRLCTFLIRVMVPARLAYPGTNAPMQKSLCKISLDSWNLLTILFFPTFTHFEHREDNVNFDCRLLGESHSNHTIFHFLSINDLSCLVVKRGKSDIIDFLNAKCVNNLKVK